MIEAIIPAAGLATRMRGLPKFLLPCDANYTTLIEKQVFGLLPHVDLITIALRHDFIHLLDSLELPSAKVRILSIGESKSMTQTVQIAAADSSADQFVVVMPDTYFYGDEPFEALSKDLGSTSMRLAVWKIRDEQKGKLGQVDFDQKLHLVVSSRDKDIECDFDWSWGAMTFKRHVLDLSDADMPHTGYLIGALLESGKRVEGFEVLGDYYDCGTPKEYFDLIDRIRESKVLK